MTAVIYVLASLLAGAVIATLALYSRLGGLEDRIAALKSRNAGMQAEINYWIEISARNERRYKAARDGLVAVRNLRTGKMASIGNRMFQAAGAALSNAGRVE